MPIETNIPHDELPKSSAQRKVEKEGSLSIVREQLENLRRQLAFLKTQKPNMKLHRDIEATTNLIERMEIKLGILEATQKSPEDEQREEAVRKFYEGESDPKHIN